MKIFISLILSISVLNVSAQDVDESSSMTLSVNSGNPVILGSIPVIYDDTIDGDLGDRTAPTPIVLGAGSSRVIGNVGGADFDDCMTFSVPAGNNVLSITLSSYVASGGNATSGFQLYTGNLPGSGNFGDLVDTAVGPANIGQDILSDNAASPLTSGDYSLCFLEGTANQVFTVDFGTDIVAAVPPTPVPVNNRFMLLLLSLVLLFVGSNLYKKKFS